MTNIPILNGNTKEYTSISQSNILADALSKIDDTEHRNGIFIVKSGSQWLKEASAKPKPKPLFLCVWFQGEVCILYAETNTGKSILAVWIAYLISLDQPVLYIDFELSDKQFEARYSNDFKNHFPFPPNFQRAEINPDEADYHAAGFNTLEEYINHSIKVAVLQTGAKVLIIDNLTYLRNETEKAKEALPLMKHLKALKNELGLSILVLAHTPKRNPSLPITRNDLQGSKMLINFCDSAFAIGESQKDKRLRYLKQIKSRNAEILFDTDNVALFEITKPDNFLSFTPVQAIGNVHDVQTSSEHEHLKQHTKEDKEIYKERAIELNNKGYSQRDIAKEIGISLGSVNKYLRT